MLKLSTLLIYVEQVAEKSNKLDLLRKYLSEINPVEFTAAVQIFTNRLKLKTLTTDELFSFAQEFSGLPEWLIQESIKTAGDDVEGLTLILPVKPSEEENLTLSAVIEKIQKIKTTDISSKKNEIYDLWKKLHSDSRLTVNKLMTSRFRSPFSLRELAEIFSVLTSKSPLQHYAELLDTKQKISYETIFSSSNEMEKYRLYEFRNYPEMEFQKMNSAENDVFYFQEIPDGDRAFLIKRDDFISLWTETENRQIKQSEMNFCNQIPNGVFEIYLTKPNNLTFTITDVYEWNGNDITSDSRMYKTEILDAVQSDLQLSESILLLPWQRMKGDFLNQLDKNRTTDIRFEHETDSSLCGLIKPGRKRLKAALLYAQKEEQNRYTLTVGLLNDGQWIPVAKIKEELPKDELHELDQYIRKNTLEKFGPVRTVKPDLVFEITFERISESGRHKSGIILHAPRMERWLKFAKVEDLIPLKTLINDLI